jgi:hypothetical protein
MGIAVGQRRCQDRAGVRVDRNVQLAPAGPAGWRAPAPELQAGAVDDQVDAVARIGLAIGLETAAAATAWCDPAPAG